MMKNDLLQMGGKLDKGWPQKGDPRGGVYKYGTSGSISLIVVEIMARVINRVNVRTYTHTPWRQKTINSVV